ncbi:hypothetical protein QN400_10695 [Pseudomonas sp. RTC3]|mgnify:CR=1 FL=1|uniref:hypothetical protein n=1 Tax=unclassified Pseudomonas TaxID=196821 RepID=UPI002AB354A1|nr:MULTISPECIES: hypothetical protein [unclassified Pseudomonas]MEB0062495.1 hypothetical protein [Pseudomonas sp. RTC3]MDY7565826.1 hypothetical protein [Pseudomonas sp. 5C2]MEB0027561.1 hypothetical protein [Pseudomonas sp. MH9.2]MEB0240500.1 hypothetical protein [Pseudomonas sp. 5C2]WPX70379.1 hypothetical protein RHM55_07360 [Pseudomonas sp. MH9.2]
MSWESISYWIEHHPGLASWVQALGSILAILVAVRVASSQKREQLKNERIRFERDCEFLKVISDRALRAAKPNPAEITVRDAARMLVGVSSIFKKIDLMSLPHASLIEPVSTIRDALQAAESSIEGEPRIELYFGSSEHDKWYRLIFLARNRLLEEINRIS